MRAATGRLYHLNRTLINQTLKITLLHYSISETLTICRESSPHSTQFRHGRPSLHISPLSALLALLRRGSAVEDSYFSGAVKCCATTGDDSVGWQLHCLSLKHGVSSAAVGVATSLLDFYMKTEKIEHARKVFDDMPYRNVVSWTSLISGYKHNGMPEEAALLFPLMLTKGIHPNTLTFSTVIGALSVTGALTSALQLHAFVLKLGFESATCICNSLLGFYSRAGMIRAVKSVFFAMDGRDPVSWNCAISGFVSTGLFSDALHLFLHMRVAGVLLTEVVFLVILKLCADTKDETLTRNLHSLAVKTGFFMDDRVRTAAMSAYTGCGRKTEAFSIFSVQSPRTVVSWTAVISGLLHSGDGEYAAVVFLLMLRDGVTPNHFTLSALLSARPSAFPTPQLHSLAAKTGCETAPAVGTALLQAYISKGDTKAALKVFDTTREKDTVAWSAMIVSMARAGEPASASAFFRRLLQHGTSPPNEYTFSGIINTCLTGDHGRQLHSGAIKAGFSGSSRWVSSALVSMYSNRGRIEEAERVFREAAAAERDVALWNSMISGLGQHGRGEEAVRVFEEMRAEERAEADGGTLAGVIGACAGAGLVEQGRVYFETMTREMGIAAGREHYSSLVDLYGRAGMLREAAGVIAGMGEGVDAGVWRTLLGACRMHMDVGMGEVAAGEVAGLDPEDSSSYVLLSNMYGAVGNWEGKGRVRRGMEDRGVRKQTGKSWVELGEEVYVFTSGGVCEGVEAGLAERIGEKLEELAVALKGAGYEPETGLVGHNVEEEEKAAILGRHSERLALAFGLLVVPPVRPIRIDKNLRVCVDCHRFFKLVARIEGRVFVLRDTRRFHHFSPDGACSCRDFW